MTFNRINIFRGAASVCIAVQIITACIPGFFQVLTQTERHLHYAATLWVVAVFAWIDYSYTRSARNAANAMLRVTLICVLMPLFGIEQLFVGTKSFLPLFSERLALVIAVPLSILAFSWFAKKGAARVRHSSSFRDFNNRSGVIDYRRG